MDDLNKLKHLLEHWIEHNEEHASTYADWAAKAREMGRPELEAVLKEIAGETRRMDKLFRMALKECG